MRPMRAAWWWIDRWRKSTAYNDMTLAEQGAYRNLLDELWLRDGVLPKEERILAKVSGDALAWPAVRDKVLARFTVTDDGLRHSTHDEVAAFPEVQAAKGRARAANAPRNGGRFTSQKPAEPPAGSPADNQPESPAQHQPPSPSPSPSPYSGSVSETVHADSPEPLRDSTPTVLKFPTVGKGGSSWSLTQWHVENWRELYPGLDVLAECRRAKAWVEAKSTHRKTAQGMPTFLVGWLNRATDHPQRSDNMDRADATRAPRRVPWVCPHIDSCGHRPMCEIKLAQPKKYPVKAQVSA